MTERGSARLAVTERGLYSPPRRKEGPAPCDGGRGAGASRERQAVVCPPSLRAQRGNPFLRLPGSAGGARPLPPAARLRAGVAAALDRFVAALLAMTERGPPRDEGKRGLLL